MCPDDLLFDRLHAYGPLQTKKPKLIALAEATPETCGAKAAACAELTKVAEQNAGVFSAPSGACLVFGNMETALQVTHYLT